MPMVRIVPRGFTGTVTYHTPTQRFILIIPVHIGIGLTYHAHGTHCTSWVHRYGHLLYPDTEVHIDHTRTHWYWPHIPCPWFALYLGGFYVRLFIYYTPPQRFIFMTPVIAPLVMRIGSIPNGNVSCFLATK